MKLKRKKKKTLKKINKMTTVNMDLEEQEKILLLIQDLADLPCTVVQQNLNKYIQNKTGAKVSLLAPILPETEEIVVHVVGEKVLEKGLRFEVTKDLLGKTVRKNESKDGFTEFDYEVLRHLGSVIETVPVRFLSIPIEHPVKDHIALVVCIIDYPNESNSAERCSKIIQECFRFCLGLLLSTLKCQEETRLKHQCQDLLIVSRKIFLRLGDLRDLLREIMMEARKLTNAERCSLFLVDDETQELVAKVFDGQLTNDDVRLTVGQGVAGHVAVCGDVLNIRNAYEHPLFFSGVDETTGFRTRNILCFPIRNENGIIGVAQLCNKMDGLYFDVCDEEVAVAFSIYCGITIMHSIIYKKIHDTQTRSKLSNELMMYHMQQVEDETVDAILNCEDDHCPPDFDKFTFSPRHISEDHTPCYVLKMFDELGFTAYWRIKRKTLARFILYVKKGYRDAPYHNWLHAFSVAHFSYLMIKNLNLIGDNYMTKLQALVFLVSGLCHDIDHRGTNNSFQTQCGTLLASLYSSEGSVMERHHLAQSMCILNTEDCNIFESLSSNDYSEALDLLRNNILATDLASHFRTIEKQNDIINNGFDRNDIHQRRLLHGMFMTCCDLSDQTKDWKMSKRTAERIYDEFFSQGDLEKSMGNAPIEMMDREKASIPHLQVEFISNLVLPLFTNLAKLFPVAQCLVDTIEKNREVWRTAIVVFQRYTNEGIKGMDILLNPNIESDILTAHSAKRGIN